MVKHERGSVAAAIRAGATRPTGYRHICDIFP